MQAFHPPLHINLDERFCLLSYCAEGFCLLSDFIFRFSREHDQVSNKTNQTWIRRDFIARRRKGNTAVGRCGILQQGEFLTLSSASITKLVRKGFVLEEGVNNAIKNKTGEMG